MRKLPIRRIAFSTPDAERARLVEKGKQLYDRALAGGGYDTVLSFVAEQLEHQPERSDVVHDLIAFLAEQMIEMNKRKQAEVKGFLTWLERQIGAKVDDLANKTKLRKYHDHDLNTLLAVLRQNKRKLQGVDPDARPFQESVEREFNSSLTKLMPLKQRLAFTDRLIDLIVYRLYGLTDDEVAIVEGAAKA